MNIKLEQQGQKSSLKMVKTVISQIGSTTTNSASLAFFHLPKGCLQNKKAYILGLCPKVVDPLPSPPIWDKKY